MAKGLYLFNDLVPADLLPEKQQKGRSKTLISRRDELLLDRLYHFKKVFPWDYEYVLKILSTEFFLTELTIPQVTQKPGNTLYIRGIQLKQPDQTELQKKWPHLVWDKKSLLLIYGIRQLKTA